MSRMADTEGKVQILGTGINHLEHNRVESNRRQLQNLEQELQLREARMTSNFEAAVGRVRHEVRTEMTQQIRLPPGEC